MAQNVKPADRAFRTVTVPGNGFVEGFDDLETAELDAHERSERAISMGLETRYRATVK